MYFKPGWQDVLHSIQDRFFFYTVWIFAISTMIQLNPLMLAESTFAASRKGSNHCCGIVLNYNPLYRVIFTTL